MKHSNPCKFKVGQRVELIIRGVISLENGHFSENPYLVSLDSDPENTIWLPEEGMTIIGYDNVVGKELLKEVNLEQ